MPITICDDDNFSRKFQYDYGGYDFYIMQREYL